MAQFVHDGSFDGLLCALATALRNGTTPEGLAAEDQRQTLLFCDEVQVRTDPAVAREMAGRIRDKISRQAFRNTLHVHLSELPDLGLPLFDYIREGLARGECIDRWHAHASVRAVHEAAQKTTREIHRFKGLLRFRELADGTLWAPVEPDHQIILPLALHFSMRLSLERGIIHDLRRGTAVAWVEGSVRYLAPPTPSGLPLAGHERDIQRLWQTYIRSGTIAERANAHIKKRCMPVRYWKWLTEKAA